MNELLQTIRDLPTNQRVQFNITNGEIIEGEALDIYNINGKRFLNIQKPNGYVQSVFIENIEPFSFRTISKSRHDAQIAISPRPIAPPDSRPPQSIVEPSIVPHNSSGLMSLTPQVKKGLFHVFYEPTQSVEIDGKVFQTIGDQRFISLPIIDRPDARMSAEILSIKRDMFSDSYMIEIQAMDTTRRRIYREFIDLEDLKLARVSSKSKLNFSQPEVKRKILAQDVFGENPMTYAQVLDENNMFSNIVLDLKGREVRLIRDGKQIQIAREEGRFFRNVPIRSLQRNKSYTYVITEDGDVVFGMVDDSWETGVKHMNLSQGRNVVVAGEIKILPDGKIDFNVDSGSFTKKIILNDPIVKRKIKSKLGTSLNLSADDELKIIEESNVGLSKKVHEFFKRQDDSLVLQYNPTKLLPKDPPSLKRLKFLCKDPRFFEINQGLCP